MPYEFQLSFTELCAFVPNRNRDLLRVLLVNALDETTTPSGAPLPAHQPRIRFLAADLRARHGDPDLRSFVEVDENGDATEYWEWHLRFDHVVVRYDDAEPVPLKLETEEPDSSRPEPASEAERSDLRWVVNVADLAPDAATVDPDCFEPHPRKELISARFEIDSGDIGTHSFSDKGPNHSITPAVTGAAPESDPTRLVRGFEQAVALFAGVRRPVSSGRVRIEATSFVEGEDRHAWVELEPENGTSLLVIVTNSPEQLSEAELKDLMSHVPLGFAVGFDFMRYYSLSTNPGAGMLIPARREAAQNPGGAPHPVGIGVKPHICGLSRFPPQ